MYEIVLQLTDEVVAEIQAGCHGDARLVMDMAKQCDVTLVAQHPGVEDSELASYFSAQVADPDSAQQIRQRFSNLKGVTAAYVKSPGRPP